MEVTTGLAESNCSLLLGLLRDSLHVTCGLTACTPGSAPGPTLGYEYGKTLPFTFTDLESILHASTPTSIIPTKFEVDMTTHCRVIAFLSADTSRDFVTWTFDLLTLNSCCAWRVT